MKENQLKNSVLIVCKIWKLLVNILIPDENYSLSVKASVQHNELKWNCLEIEKTFLKFFLQFGNLDKILNTLENKMSIRGDFFLKL